MTNAARFLAVAAAVLAFGGCAIDPGIRPFWTLHDSDFRQLKPGMAKAEVQNIVGKPHWTFNFPRLEEEVWEYSYLDYQTRMKALAHFDTRGILKYHTQSFDQDYYSSPDN
ncbi:MAG: outer membrane protein assembly factor BamE [Burkholderiales bacterium]